MIKPSLLLTTTLLASLLAAAPALSETMLSQIAFNTGIGTPTGEQPPDGVRVAYQVAPTGALKGCTVDIVEVLNFHDEGAWGFWDVAGTVTCADGGFAYTVTALSTRPASTAPDRSPKAAAGSRASPGASPRAAASRPPRTATSTFTPSS